MLFVVKCQTRKIIESLASVLAVDRIDDTDLIHSSEREETEQDNERHGSKARNCTDQNHHPYIGIHDVHDELIEKNLAYPKSCRKSYCTPDDREEQILNDEERLIGKRPYADGFHHADLTFFPLDRGLEAEVDRYHCHSHNRSCHNEHACAHDDREKTVVVQEKYARSISVRMIILIFKHQFGAGIPHCSDIVIYSRNSCTDEDFALERAFRIEQFLVVI